MTQAVRIQENRCNLTADLLCDNLLLSYPNTFFTSYHQISDTSHSNFAMNPERGGLLFRPDKKKAEENSESRLGLDRLAAEKRAASSGDAEQPRKHYRSHDRQDTPSHPGGLSKDARDRLDDYRRNRDRYRGQFLAPLSEIEVANSR